MTARPTHCPKHSSQELIQGHCWLCSGEEAAQRDRRAQKGFSSPWGRKKRRPKLEEALEIPISDEDALSETELRRMLPSVTMPPFLGTPPI